MLPLTYCRMLYVPSLWMLAHSVMLAAPSLTDLTQRKIPNGLTLIICVFGLISGTHDDGISGLSSAAGGAAVAGSVFLLLYGLGVVGGGDVKLATGFGSLVGYDLAPSFIGAAWICMAAWSLFDLLRRRHWTFLVGLSHALRAARLEKRTLPMAPALAMGAINADIVALWLK